jgi:hypothetical protein
MLFKDIFSSTIIMIEQFKNLPIELINKIMLYLSTDTSVILRPIIKEYGLYMENNIDTYSFKEYINKEDPRYLFNELNVKLHKKHNDHRLDCYGCGKYINKDDFYIKRYVSAPFRFGSENDFYKKCIANAVFNCLVCHKKRTEKIKK